MTDLNQALNDLAPTVGWSPSPRCLSGGASQETWAFTLDTGRPLILRRKPPGTAGVTGTQTPLATEAALIRAAALRAAPVPEVLAICDPDSAVGEL